MTIDPRVGFWFSIVAAVVSVFGAAGAQYTTLFGQDTSVKILAVIGLVSAVINSINAVLHAIPSPSDNAAKKSFYLGPKANG